MIFCNYGKLKTQNTQKLRSYLAQYLIINTSINSFINRLKKFLLK